MSPIDTLLTKTEPFGLRQSGPSRWRCACPVCGGRNRSTLSIGETAEGAVLLKCFKSGCDVESIARALGVDVTELFPPRGSTGARIQRVGLLTASQALELLDEEAAFVAVLAATLAKAQGVGERDRDRALKAAGRVGYLRMQVKR